jgi:hypothetical protein
MEIVKDIAEFIQNVGFPIAICCFLLFQNSKQDQYNREQNAKLQTAIENNTKTINKLQTAIAELCSTVKGE